MRKLKRIWFKLREFNRRYHPQIESYGLAFWGSIEVGISSFLILYELSISAPVIMANLRTLPIPADPFGLLFHISPIAVLCITCAIGIGLMGDGVFRLAKSVSVFDYHERRLVELNMLLDAIAKMLEEKMLKKAEAKNGRRG